MSVTSKHSCACRLRPKGQEDWRIDEEGSTPSFPVARPWHVHGSRLLLDQDDRRSAQAERKHHQNRVIGKSQSPGEPPPSCNRPFPASATLVEKHERHKKEKVR